MRRILTLTKKDLIAYFFSPVFYIFTGLMIGLSIWLFMADFFVIGQSSFDRLWSQLVFLIIFFIPAITMNLIAEEKKLSTMELLVSYPVTIEQIIIAKFLSSLVFCFFSLIPLIPTLTVLMIIGNFEIGLSILGYVSILVTMISFSVVGLFFSSLSSEPIISFLLSFTFILLNYFLSADLLVNNLPPFVAKILSYVSIFYHSSRLQKGMLSLDSFLFFISWTVVFLSLTILFQKFSRYKK